MPRYTPAVIFGAVAALTIQNAVAADAPVTAPPADPAVALRAQLALERKRHAAEVRGLRSQLASRTTIDSAIRTASVATGVPSREIRRVAHCESRLRANAIGRTPVGPERAVGLMQWLPSSFSRTRYGRVGLSPFDPYVSALAAAETVKREGWAQWACKP